MLNQEDYISKTNTFLTENNIQKTKKNLMPTYVRNVKRTIEHSQDTISKFDTDYRRLINMHNRTPTLYSLIKLHKEDKSIRPIVTTTNTPSCKLAKFLQTTLTKKLGFRAARAIINTSHLIEQIKNIKITQHTKILSLDIRNLYTNIPVKETIDIVKQFLERNTDGEHIDDTDMENLIDLIKIVTEQNFFNFQNNQYSMNDGLSMGSALSGLLAEFFMNNLEDEVFSERYRFFSERLVFYGRYVDDIIIIHNESQAFTTAIHNLFESMSNLSFTVEKEDNNSLNFLDLTIHKNVLSGILEFEIYRKPTQTDVIIPKNSYTSDNHKQAALRHLLYRASSVPMSDLRLEKEVQTIINIAKNNGYDIDEVQRIYNRIHNGKIINTVYPHKRKMSKFVITDFQQQQTHKVKKY